MKRSKKDMIDKIIKEEKTTLDLEALSDADWDNILKKIDQRKASRSAGISKDKITADLREKGLLKADGTLSRGALAKMTPTEIAAYRKHHIGDVGLPWVPDWTTDMWKTVGGWFGQSEEDAQYGPMSAAAEALSTDLYRGMDAWAGRPTGKSMRHRKFYSTRSEDVSEGEKKAWQSVKDNLTTKRKEELLDNYVRGVIMSYPPDKREAYLEKMKTFKTRDPETYRAKLEDFASKGTAGQTLGKQFKALEKEINDPSTGYHTDPATNITVYNPYSHKGSLFDKVPLFGLEIHPSLTKYLSHHHQSETGRYYSPSKYRSLMKLGNKYGMTSNEWKKVIYGSSDEHPIRKEYSTDDEEVLKSMEDAVVKRMTDTIAGQMVHGGGLGKSAAAEVEGWTSVDQKEVKEAAKKYAQEEYDELIPSSWTSAPAGRTYIEDTHETSQPTHTPSPAPEEPTRKQPMVGYTQGGVTTMEPLKYTDEEVEDVDQKSVEPEEIDYSKKYHPYGGLDVGTKPQETVRSAEAEKQKKGFDRMKAIRDAARREFGGALQENSKLLRKIDSIIKEELHIIQEQQTVPQPVDPRLIDDILDGGVTQYVDAIGKGMHPQAGEILGQTLQQAVEETMNADAPPADPKGAQDDLYADFMRKVDQKRPGAY